MANNDLIEKVIQVTGVGGIAAGGGLLAPQQAERFIDYMWDSTVLASQVRALRMRSTIQEFDRIAIGERLVRVATEAVDDGANAGATFSKISITTQKFRLDWELSTEALEDNLEGAALEDHIARLMATQAGKDLEDVAINGDVLLTTDPLLKGLDGWSKRANAGGVVVDAAGGTLDRGVLNQALRAMPRSYLQRRGELKFFTSTGAIQDYLFSVQTVSDTYVTDSAAAQAGVNRSVVPEGPAGFVMGNAFGLQIQEVPLFREDLEGDYTQVADTDPVTTGAQPGPDPTDEVHTEMWLTFPKNLLWGVKREIKVTREYKPKKDTIEYTMFTRVGTQIENAAAFVVVKNLRTS